VEAVFLKILNPCLPFYSFNNPNCLRIHNGFFSKPIAPIRLKVWEVRARVPNDIQNLTLVSIGLIVAFTGK